MKPWLVVATSLCMLAGCGADSARMRVWGSASWNGVPINTGQIVFFPIDDTKGPSTGGSITDGRYEVPARVGPNAGGKYRVEITSYGEERSYNPNASGAGMSATVRRQLIPAAYNQQTKLRVEISSNPDENQHNFELP